jgi:hypothetical protein
MTSQDGWCPETIRESVLLGKRPLRSVVVDGPARTAIHGGKTAKSEKDLVGLFLDGCRDRTARL